MTGRDDRPTPHLVVDADVLDANVAAMAAFARDHGLVLRPHAKTHKSPDGTGVGLTVATVSEAEVFAAAGCRDLFVAYPLWVDAAKGARLRGLAGSGAGTQGVASGEGARARARKSTRMETRHEDTNSIP